MKVNAIQQETFSGNAVKATANKGYSILVGGERYVVGVADNAVSASKNIQISIIDAIKRVASQPIAKNGLNLLA